MQHPTVTGIDHRQRRPFRVGDAMILIIALCWGRVGPARPFSLAFRIRSVPVDYFCNFGNSLNSATASR